MVVRGEVAVAGAETTGSRCTDLQEADMEEHQCLDNFLFVSPWVKPTTRVGLVSLVKLLWNCLHRYTQWYLLSDSKSYQVDSKV